MIKRLQKPTSILSCGCANATKKTMLDRGRVQKKKQHSISVAFFGSTRGYLITRGVETAQERPRTTQDQLKMAQNDPKTAQNSVTIASDYPNMAKDVPGWTQTAPRRPRVATRRPKMAPDGPR